MSSLSICSKSIRLDTVYATLSRRIKLGLVVGIKTFYLLARSEKVEILKEVVKDLLHTGNFIQINKAKEYKDNLGRPVVCYCIHVNEDSLLSNALKEIGEAIKSGSTVQGIVTKVRQNQLNIEVNGIEGIVKRQNLSVLDLDDARLFFRENSSLEVKPIELKENGIVEHSLIGTSSDPNYLLSTDFTIGKSVSGKVDYIDDTFIKIDIGHDKVKGIVFREDLTPSRFVLLNHKFEIGQELRLKVKGYNYDKANIILESIEKIEQWPVRGYKIGQKVKFIVCKKTSRSLVGEISEGVEGVIPFWEMDYFESQIDDRIHETRLGSTIDCVITKIDNEEKTIFLSYRNLLENPYSKFLDSNAGAEFEFMVDELNVYGIQGHLIGLDFQYDVYIPKNEMSWDGEAVIEYKKGQKKRVVLKYVDKRGDRFIGTFKPIVKHPLDDFNKLFNEGQVLKNLTVKKVLEFGIIYEIKVGKRYYDALLFKGEVSNLCFITDIESLSELNAPLVIKHIDFERNRITLSLKELLMMNEDRIEGLDYALEYDATILGRCRDNTYAIVLNGVWIEGNLETTKTYSIGQKVKARPASIGHNKVSFVDE